MSVPSSDSAGIRQTIRALKAAGYTLVSVFDGEEDVPVKSEAQAIDAITAVDDAHLFVRDPMGEYNPWIRFVLGNSPEEVICDYGVSLEDVIGPLMDSWEE